MRNEILYIANSKKLDELVPEARWAAQCWLSDCFNLDLQFRVSEVYRTPQRQNELYAQGRTKGGPIVTWTLDSNHIKRLAADIYPLNCSHADIFAVAKRYGITHPWPKNDPPHYEFSKAKKKPEPVVARAPASIDEAIRKLARQLKSKKPGVAYDRLKARLEELKAKK